MGTDIHAVVETKFAWSEWRMESTHDIIRNYPLFALLADVRNSDDQTVPIALPRGYPADVSMDTVAFLEVAGDHSSSWISSQEFERYFPWRDRSKDVSDFEMAGWSYVIKTRYYRWEWRIVFNFDS